MQEINRLFLAPSKSFFLFGPRGTGKTTFVKSLFKDALWVNLLRPEVLRKYQARPESLYEEVRGHKGLPVIILDEVQKAPELLSIVHFLMEENKSLKFILTGSSARKLKRVGVNLLAGRALNCHLHPFMASELGDLFSLDAALKNGMLPLVFQDKNPAATLDTYVSLYLQEEVHMESLVRRVDNFTRFLEVISFSHGSQLNLANVARECEVKRKTVENYVSILEDLLLSYQLPVFSKRAQRQLVVHPKFYIFDAGVYRALRPEGVLDRREEIDGAVLEGLVFQHLKAWNDYSDKPHTLGFWRTKNGVEVDFIVYGPSYFWAIEVKNTKKISASDVRGLEIFLTDYPSAKAILLYRGDQYLKINNILCVPCEDFLRQLKPNQDVWMDADAD